MCERTLPGMPRARLPENLKMGDAGSIADRARTYIEFLVGDPDSQPGMARDSSRPEHAINHLGRKRATQRKHRPDRNPQPVIDFFQRQRLLLTVPHTSFKGSGRGLPGIEPRVGEFSRNELLRIGDEIPALQLRASARLYCVLDGYDPIHRHTAGLGQTAQHWESEKSEGDHESPSQAGEDQQYFSQHGSSPLLRQTSEHSHQRVTHEQHKDSTKADLMLTESSRLTTSSRGKMNTGRSAPSGGMERCVQKWAP